jgi:signal transduction histidine kinase
MRHKRTIPRNVLFVCLGLLALGGIGFGVLRFLHSSTRGLPYHDSFANGVIDDWKAYGGTWEVVDGNIRNDSDEHGSKLITGSSYWQDYSVEADVQLLRTGDVGLIVRASDEERGVDAYSGYYAGLRTWGTSSQSDLQNTLVIGLAKHGWVEYSTRPIPGGVRPSEWYHLKVVARGCTITATATNPRTGKSLTASMRQQDCFRAGKIGLRSFAAGGLWRNVRVNAVNAPVIETGEITTAPLPPFALRYAPGAAESSASAARNENLRAPKLSLTQNSHASRSHEGQQQNFVRTVGDLKLHSATVPSSVTVRGVVVLTTPEIYVQDSTGGVAVPNPKGPPLRTGDVVEVTGLVEPHAFSSTLREATIRPLWEHEPIPPISVTANQAATGAYDATFIELEGILREKAPGPNGTWTLTFDYGRQSFKAVTHSGHGKEQLPKLTINSLLRLRGVCVADVKYTKAMTPFVVLLPSTNAVEVVAGPPWWSARYLIAIAVSSVVFLLVAHLLYMRVRHWRLCAILEERGRLAHELHDTLAQSFAGIGFQLQAIRNGVPKDASLTHQQLDQASDLVRHSHEEARRSIATLRPESLQTCGLANALETCVNRMVEGGSVQVVVSTIGTPSVMPLQIKDTLYRIGQEAIANAIRHATPDAIRIEVQYERASVRLSVEDDGVGFEPEANSNGFGLIGMRKRAESISANLTIDSKPGCGTRMVVTAELPPPITLMNWPRHFLRYVVEGHSDEYTNSSKNPYSYR